MRTIMISLPIYLGRKMRMRMTRETRMISSLTGRRTKRRKMNGRMMKMGLICMPKI